MKGNKVDTWIICKKSIKYLFLIFILISIGCSEKYDRIEKIDIDHDGSVDVIQYYKGSLLKKENLITRYDLGQRSRTVYWKDQTRIDKIVYEKNADSEIEYFQLPKLIAGHVFEQEIDIKKTHGKDAKRVVGSSFTYTQNQKILFTKVLFKDFAVNNVVIYDEYGYPKKNFHFNLRKSLDYIELYDRGKIMRMFKGTAIPSGISSEDEAVLKLLGIPINIPSQPT